MEAFFGIIHSTLIGVGLAASCGFRVFVPMLVMSIAVRAGQLELSHGWDWLGSWPAITAFAVATVAEICGYYIPWVDHALDAFQTPVAVVAGVITTAACVSEMSPLLQWTTAIIAGGGIAGAIHARTALLRGASTVTTGGFGNFLVSTFELATSFVLSIVAILVPILAGVILVALGCVMVRRVWRLKMRRAVVAAAKE